VERRVQDDGVVFLLAGELDPHTAPALQEQIEGEEGPVVLDLAGVTFLDSAGIRAIVSAHEQLSASGAALTIRRPSDVARRVFEIAGLLDHLTVE
jgi:anti-sigma B factor antagonist